MIVAITYENGNVFMHYGKTRQFKIYEIDNNEIKSSRVIDCGEYSHHTLADLLALNNVDTLICGGLGGHDVESLMAKNIRIFNNASGNVDIVINEFLKGNLSFSGASECGCHH